MPWFKFTKMTITLSVEADDEEDAVGQLDAGIWDANQPSGFSVQIDTKEDD